MALIVADRVKQESTTTGTGNFTLSSGVDGFQSFSTVCSTNDTMYYCIQDKVGTDFEIGHGTFNGSGQLERTNVLQSSNSDNAVDFSSGTKEVFITYPADKAVFQNYDGSITIPSTIDGRDLQTDGTKLDAIEASATADQTATEIRTLVESATDSNVFTDADHTKLNGIEASATADQTGAEIKSAYEGEADTNAFTDTLLSKLNGIEASATADQSGAEIKTAYEGEADTNAFTDALQTKLNGIATGAEVNVNADWNSSSGDSQIQNKPTLAAVATSGAYSDLSGTPTIPSAIGGSTGVDFNDDVKARFGTGNDFEIFHEASNNRSIISESGTGDLHIRANDFYIKNAAGTETMFYALQDGAVGLYNDDTLTFFTTATGAEIDINANSDTSLKIENANTGTAARASIFLDANAGGGQILALGSGYTTSGNYVADSMAFFADTAMSNGMYIGSRATDSSLKLIAADAVQATVKNDGIKLADNKKLSVGSSNDFQIYHDTNNTILTNGTGQFKINGDDIHFMNAADSETMLDMAANGAVTLYHNDSAKLATSSGGVSVTGSLTASSNVTAYSSRKLKSDIETIDNGLEKVSKMRGVTFTKDNEKSSGVIAEELEEVAPELVIDGEYKSVAYGNIAGYLIEAIKQLKERNEKLELIVNRLITEVEENDCSGCKGEK